MQDALRIFFRPTMTGDSRTDFYSAYQKETTEHDERFVKQWDESLNVSLLFVSYICPKQMQSNNHVVRLVYFLPFVPHSSSI